jgi:hypothetical protein
MSRSIMMYQEYQDSRLTLPADPLPQQSAVSRWMVSSIALRKIKCQQIAWQSAGIIYSNAVDVRQLVRGFQ